MKPSCSVASLAQATGLVAARPSPAMVGAKAVGVWGARAGWCFRLGGVSVQVHDVHIMADFP
eukprot:11184204-Lingulodinium_polyedra.AAC.1